MNWTIIWPRKVLSFKDRTVREQEIEKGQDLDELLDLIKYAYKEGEEITLTLEEYDPTPEFLYDNTGSEPAISADERWQAAFQQKQEALK
jgi:hypothetical protein